MVLTQVVGKKRSFGRGLLLTILTFGIYGVYWLYKAHDELFKQFELQRESRDEGVVWLILGLVLFPFQFVYTWIFSGNVEYLRQRLELPRTVSSGKFVGLQLAAYGTLFVGYIPLLISFSGLSPDATEPDITAAMMGGIGLFIALALVALGILLYAYWLLQSSINDIWDAYERRMHALAQPAAAGAAATGASFTYWGDLQPRAPTLSAPHVRARAEALARDHPDAGLPPELPDLLQRGDAGDEAALSAAAALLDGADRIVQERAKLHRDLAEMEAKQGRLAGRLANGEIDNAAYQSARGELERERGRIEARLAELRAKAPPPS